MANDIMAFVKFSDGSIAALLAAGASAQTATELPTGGTGLNQVSGVSIGSAFQGKTAIAASVACQGDAATVADPALAMMYAYFLGPDGKIITLAQGGGGATSGMNPLARPVQMRTGVKFIAAFQASADGVNFGSLAVCCTDGTADVFSTLGIADTKTPMLNKDSATIGQALAGKTIKYAYATYNATKGLNEDGAGVGAFFMESSDGQLKHMFVPCKGLGEGPQPWIPGYNTQIGQNDTLSIMATS